MFNKSDNKGFYSPISRAKIIGDEKDLIDIAHHVDKANSERPASSTGSHSFRNVTPPEEPKLGDTYPMSTVATLVVGQDGSATKNASSANITSKADRAIFLDRRRQVDVIIIGGNTARNEPYKRTPAPLIICSRGSTNPVAENPIAQLWNCSPSEAVDKARKLFGENILIEGGPKMIIDLVNSGKIDQLELSLTQATGGENIVDWQLLLTKFKNVEMKQIDDTYFYSAMN